MKETVLQQWVVERIKKNSSLFGEVADYLGNTPRYFLNVLRDNPPHLTQAGVLEILKEELDVLEDSELLTTRVKEEKTAA
jgi:hypothetical protein